MNAYILVQTEIGRAPGVLRDLSAVPGIAADSVTGPYDVIVRTEAVNFDELEAKVLKPLESVDGVIRTLTCFARLAPSPNSAGSLSPPLR